MALKELLDGLKEITDEYASGLGPEDDWAPMLLVVNEGKFSIIGIEMPPQGEVRQKLFSSIIPNQIHKDFPNAQALVMVVSTWYAVVEDGDQFPDTPLSDRPDRKEGLVLQGISKSEEVGYFAEIIRTDTGVELDWKSEMEEAVFCGPLMSSLRRALWT
jgi:hypothetical protein